MIAHLKYEGNDRDVKFVTEVKGSKAFFLNLVSCVNKGYLAVVLPLLLFVD